MGKELFSNIPSKVETLLSDIEDGRTGLPDLQRPFVWMDNKVRDLLDSMLKGYPIGYIMLWSSPYDYDKKTQIGQNEKMYKQPDDLVIDGQQRLTALLAAMYGHTIRDKNYKKKEIKISFNPLTREFKVWTSATEKDPEFISRISLAFDASRTNTVSKFRKAYIKRLNEYLIKEGKEELKDEQEELIETNIQDLLSLETYDLPVLKIKQTASEEDVAEIFVRVNSGGRNLTEQDFIETLLAVYDNDVHTKINKFCAEARFPQYGTAFNPIFIPDTTHLIRMAVSVGFQRARLKYAYMLLRGKNLRTGEVTRETQLENMQIFKQALDVVMNLNNWHAFLNLFSDVGYLYDKMILSKNAVVYCYVLYLIGKYEYKVPVNELNTIIRRWIFMSTVTSFYTGSTESEVERQFADLRSVNTAEEFINYLQQTINLYLNDDYFNNILPKELNSASASSPIWYAYLASLNILGTNMLFSTSPISKYFVAGASGTKNAIDKHHLFPKNYLASIGITEDRDRNQIANFTYIDYATNIEISDDAPSKYGKRYREKLGDEKYYEHLRQHSIPENFEELEYRDFLDKRRKLMAQKIKEAYQVL